MYFSCESAAKMQLHIRGLNTHVLEVDPTETIEIIKVSN